MNTASNTPEVFSKAEIIDRIEAAGIAATISTILPQLTPDDRLLVIADNCTDATADIARNCGATAIERQDTQRKGKGYALDFGLESIASDPPEVVIM